MKNIIKKYQYIIIGILFIIPLAYLFIFKNEVKKENTEVPSVNIQPLNTLEDFEKNARENPTYNNLIDLSVAYINNQMPEKSIEHLYKAIELNSNNAVAYNNLCVAFTLMKEYDKAIEAGTKAIELDPNFQLAKNNLAWAMDEKVKSSN
ncbi:MAG: tetratricopeptide repeat protein [Bacteroidia bacterium]